MQPFRLPRPDASPDPGRAGRRFRVPGAAARDLLWEANRPVIRHGPSGARREGDLRVASYNIHKCVGTDGRFDPGRIAAVVGELRADLVALQEVDRRFGRRTGLLDIAAIERESGLVPLRVSDLPDGLGWHGNGLLVRPGTRARLHRMALPGAEPRGAVVAELTLPCGRGPIRVVAAHLGLLRRCRLRQAACILETITQGPDMPTLLLGDLNEWRPGGRSVLQALSPVFGPVPDGPPSFPARLPVLALDRILGCRRLVVGPVEVHDSPLARVASDHLPLKAWVRLEAGATALASAA
ncbi:endonuclease/exonuclease/phosphatase family protein [Crenalkalicoccus roseus]|uniref:endonuclease/exonuclease/phosphatase family protein n=1 Tax=Crenalkalicoccus roseus TaxID=1485588 RepID=UPI001F01BF1E|nr:endonuclease/exonuclease/phosphatase family protein [Crenalkalicoccus roseus]